MSTRRDFIKKSSKGMLFAGASTLLPGVAGATTKLFDESEKGLLGKQSYIPKYKLPFNFGMGGVPFGNEFENISERQAYETMEAAWATGVRLYDVAPFYGLGLAERRYGMFLHTQNREDYVLSTKVGRLLKASKDIKDPALYPMSHSPNNVTYDYSASAVRRSIEDSLQRLGIDSIDIAYVHDVAPDNKWLNGKWLDHFEIATKGAFPELEKMKQEGIIKAWGVGVNTPEPILKVMQVANPDIILMASQYSLIEHKNALNNVFPEVRKNKVSLVMGTNLNAGFLSGSNRYNYGGKPIPAEFLKKREDLRKIAQSHNVDLRTAALQFASYPDVAAAIIPGVKAPHQIKEDWESMSVHIPKDFWLELKSAKLIEENCPINN
ncbi:aldo/keto reductase [Robertkochia solimangrovi]|uniref:aldo/keto reductase n=1 Tax=Robertkochia solimangrovi TaxID=2213046 RepID=UPI00117EB647|nr:aldo/keto reductase [Robertkochia solimangrovi]TRZ42473.1 aldo/keto reductase [Robertkochia solimangrovi]